MGSQTASKEQLSESTVTAVRFLIELHKDFNCSAFNICSTAETDEGVNLDTALHMQIIYLIIGLVGMLVNALVAGVLLHFKSMRRSLTNTFIINQSLIDGTASFFIILATFLRDIDSISNPIAQESICRLWLTNLPIWGFFVSSTYNILSVTFERYLALVHPWRHKLFTHRKAFIIMTIVWTFGPTFNATYMIPTAGMVDGECTVYSIWPSTETQTAVGILTVLVQYFIPLGLIIYAYTRIAIVLTTAGAGTKKNTDDTAKEKREHRMRRARKNVLKTLALVSSCFVFCWSLNQIYFTMYNLGFDADFNSTFYHFTVIMVFCNCCMNPIVYAVKYERFQKGVMIIFCRKTDKILEQSGTPGASGDNKVPVIPKVSQHIQNLTFPFDEISVNTDQAENDGPKNICIISQNTDYPTRL